MPQKQRVERLVIPQSTICRPHNNPSHDGGGYMGNPNRVVERFTQTSSTIQNQANPDLRISPQGQFLIVVMSKQLL